MRIINATNKLLIQSDVTLPLIDKNGSKIVTLKPGEFVFIEERGNNSALRLFEQKKMLIVDEQEKPIELDFYQVYNHFDLLKKASDELEISHEALREAVLNDERFPKALREEFANIKDVESYHSIDAEVELTALLSEEVIINQDLNQEEDISIEIVVPEGSIKNKGGRPKGSVKKETRGRPKKKGTPGRPKKKGRPAKRKR
jgi:hypothetical protein